MANYEIESFKNIQQLIRFTDQKAGALLVSNGLILTIFLNGYANDILSVVKFLFDPNQECFLYLFRMIHALCYFGYLACAIVVIYFCLNKVIRSRLAPDDANFFGELFYFQSIASKTAENFKKEFLEASQDTIKEHIVEQTYILADIMTKKTKAFVCALGFFVWSVFFFLCLCLVGTSFENLIP